MAVADTIVSRLHRFAASQPAAIAYAGEGREVGYAELCDHARAAAAWLHHLGVRQGDTVALALEDSPDDCLRSLWLWYGLSQLGAAILPLYPDVPPSRRAGLVEEFGARWLLCARTQDAPGGSTLVDPGGFGRAPGAWLGRDAPLGDHPDNPSLYHFTSGTTGTPKVCLFTAGQIVANRLAAARTSNSTTGDRFVPARRWPEMVGLRTMLRMHVVGAALVNADVPRTKQALHELVREQRVTQMSVSPYQLRVLIHSAAQDDVTPVPLRALFATGGFIAPQDIRAARKSLTPNLYIEYGSNELSTLAVLGPREPAGEAGCVGRIEPPVEAQAVDEAGLALPPGQIGQLRFRAPWMPQGYVGNPQASAERFRDGWFYPGDSGSIDGAGFLRVVGRSDEIINFGGVKIAPADVEAVLRLHPDVEDCAVAGVPDPMSGERAVAFVVLRRSQGAAELHEFCAARMDGARVPRAFCLVDRIERSPQGKVLRERMREIFRTRAVLQETRG